MHNSFHTIQETPHYITVMNSYCHVSLTHTVSQTTTFFERSMWNIFQLQLVVRYIHFITFSTCPHTFHSVCRGVL